MSDLEEANNRLLENIQKGDLMKSNLLSILVYDLAKMEEILWDSLVLDTQNVGLVKLSSLNINADVLSNIDQGLCWSSLTIPFDQNGSITMVASATLVLDPVRAAFEEAIDGQVIWYYASLSDILETLEKKFSA